MRNANTDWPMNQGNGKEKENFASCGGDAILNHSFQLAQEWQPQYNFLSTQNTSAI